MTWRTEHFSPHNLTADLIEEARYYGVYLKEPFYLFDGDDEYPDGLEWPEDLRHCDAYSLFCETCADRTVAEFVAKGFLKLDPRGHRAFGSEEFYYGPHRHEGETDDWGSCARCGVDLDVCSTDYAIRESIEYLDDNRDSEWFYKGERFHGWSPFDLMTAAKLMDRGFDAWRGASDETKERNARILQLALEVRRDYTVTASEERDARLREVGRGLKEAASSIGRLFGKWWEGMTAEPRYDEE